MSICRIEEMTQYGRDLRRCKVAIDDAFTFWKIVVIREACKRGFKRHVVNEKKQPGELQFELRGIAFNRNLQSRHTVPNLIV